MKTTVFRVTAFFSVVVLSVTACSHLEEALSDTSSFTLGISLPEAPVKTSMGASANNERKVFWADGDCVSLNGITSDALSGVAAESTKAVFTFEGSPSAPFNLLYPASFYKDATTITIPPVQNYVAGGFATDTEPLAGYIASASDPVTLNHLCTVIRLKLKKDPGYAVGTIEKVTFKGNAGEQVSGDFSIDYAGHTLTGASSDDADKLLDLSLSQALSTETALELYMVVPSGTYTDGFSVVIEDDLHRTMTKTRSVSTDLPAGKLMRLSEFNFLPGPLPTEFTLEDMEEEIMAPDGYNVTGRVVDNVGNPVQGVVVTDGTQCVRTMPNGAFYMKSVLSNVKYVYISTPSGYLPAISAGIPKFYKAKADITPSAGIYDFGDYVITPMANPNRFTIFFTADPQPRTYTATLDNVAYRSGRACEAMYRELKETAETITDRQVIGICLGDLVHGTSTTNLNLMDTYATALGTLGYPTFNIIGNHDNDLSKSNDDAAAWKYEQHFGPRNYSFNMGGIHFVMLDNIIMGGFDGSKDINDYDQGLTDAIWEWLQADMAFVPTSTKIMVCAHSPMFKLESGSERTNTAYHAGTHSDKDGGEYGYGDLFDKYTEVHAWAGHTHQTYNYVYSSTHRHKKVKVHTLARSTGELWTNEYLSDGTPQGFTVVEVNNKIITWRFHPTRYLLSSFHGTHGQPTYTYRDWNYVSNVATMKDTGEPLDETYQMHVYAPGAYEEGYLYANIFLWDSKWKTPKFTPEGGSATVMTQVDSGDANAHDLATTEYKTFYKSNYSALGSDYEAADMGLQTLFKVPVDGSVHSGTVSVTDRFGNVYTRTISW